jgi:hypothetical protein
MYVIDLSYPLKIDAVSGYPIHPKYDFSIVHRGYLDLIDS